MAAKLYETGRHLNTFSEAEAESEFKAALKNEQTRDMGHGTRCCLSASATC